MQEYRNRNVVLFNSKTHPFLFFLSFSPIHRNNSSLLKPFFLTTTTTTPFPQTLESPHTDPHRSHPIPNHFFSIPNTVDHTHSRFYPLKFRFLFLGPFFFSSLFIGHRNVGYWVELRARSRRGSVLFSGKGSPVASNYGE